MQYTRNGKKISAEEFNRVKSGNIMPGGGKPGGFLGGMMDNPKNMLGGMFKPSGDSMKLREPTAEDGNKTYLKRASNEPEPLKEDILMNIMQGWIRDREKICQAKLSPKSTITSSSTTDHHQLVEVAM